MTHYREIAMQCVTDPHRADVEAIAKHLHANESLHLHDCIEGPEPCSYCWLRAAKAVQAIERTGRAVVSEPAEHARLEAEVKRLRAIANAVRQLADQLDQDADADDGTRDERINELIDATGGWSSRDPDVARLGALVDTQRDIAKDLRRALRAEAGETP